MKQTDVLIIGAGAVGSAIAWELAKYRLDVTVVEKNEDVGGDISRANSAIIHTGYDAAPGTLESQLVVAANPMYDKIAADLDIPFERTGAILPAFTDEQFEKLPALKHKAMLNRVYDIEYLTAKELLELEPALNPEVKGGLLIPRESIIDPFILVIALAENAADNGVHFLLGTKVTGIIVSEGAVRAVKTDKGEEIRAKYIINAAGLYCDEIASYVGKNKYYVTPRKGQFYILDKKTSCKVNRIVLPIPTKTTKGKLICPTIHGNILVGPTAEDLLDKTDKRTTAEGLASIAEDVRKMVPGVVLRDTITQYSGLRAQRNPEGLNIEMYDDLAGYVDISGVRSTGLTGSVSIAKYVVDMLIESGMKAEFKTNHNPRRRGIPCFAEMSDEERAELIARDKRYGNIICRCETVTEGQICDAIHRTLGARSLDAVKRRVRAGMGRCQGGFCTPKVIEIIARELGIPVEEVRKSEPGSELVIGNLR
ncbi:MAG: NAD(P)/FAD-dependent oxidoreductase [Clostridiales bacterium]|jgi:glycerol-3-phosphate dehydrogenase|nr:NAD(P)/FAD-dependent oxidoreductase [Clostridiales bacterium]